MGRVCKCFFQTPSQDVLDLFEACCLAFVGHLSLKRMYLGKQQYEEIVIHCSQCLHMMEFIVLKLNNYPVCSYLTLGVSNGITGVQ